MRHVTIRRKLFREINAILSRLNFHHALVIKEAAPGLKGLSLRITSRLWASLFNLNVSRSDIWSKTHSTKYHKKS